MNTSKRLFMNAALAAALANATASASERSESPPLPVEGVMPPLAGGREWINSPPLTPSVLAGKVVLVGFWTYSCINWLRSFPALRAWAERYEQHGLVVVGVHTPEFEFEKDIANVRRAVAAMGVRYPVVTDPDAALWKAFGNQYWPALYLVDATGRIRHHHDGEGDEERSERVIRQLLVAAGAGDLGAARATVQPRGIEAAANWKELKSGENYIGYGRTVDFAASGGIARDRSRSYDAPTSLALNHWALGGAWWVGESFARNEASGSRLLYRFHARDLHLVMGPATPGTPVRFRVTLDGRPVGRNRGLDVDEQGFGTVSEPRLHNLVRQTSPIEDRRLEVEVLDGRLQIYSVAFG